MLKHSQHYQTEKYAAYKQIFFFFYGTLKTADAQVFQVVIKCIDFSSF